MKRGVSGRESCQGYKFVGFLDVTLLLPLALELRTKKPPNLEPEPIPHPALCIVQAPSQPDQGVLVADGACRMPDGMGWHGMG